MKKITVFAYGEVKGNPGPATINVHIVDEDGDVILGYSESIGNAKSSYADYYAVMSALQSLEEEFGEETKERPFELKLSDEAVVKQLRAESQMNDPGLVPLFIEIHNMRVASFPNLIVTHVRRELNKESKI